MSTVRIVERRYERPANVWMNYDKIVTYPEGSKLHWDVNQHTLVIRDPGGEPIAAFTSLTGIVRDDLVTVDESSESSSARSGDR